MSAFRPMPPVDAERLGHLIAANAERHLGGPVVEQYRVQMLDDAGTVHGVQLAADAEAAVAVAVAWRIAGWHTRTNLVHTAGGG